MATPSLITPESTSVTVGVLGTAISADTFSAAIGLASVSADSVATNLDTANETVDLPAGAYRVVAAFGTMRNVASGSARSEPMIDVQGLGAGDFIVREAAQFRGSDNSDAAGKVTPSADLYLAADRTVSFRAGNQLTFGSQSIVGYSMTPTAIYVFPDDAGDAGDDPDPQTASGQWNISAAQNLNRAPKSAAGVMVMEAGNEAPKTRGFDNLAEDAVTRSTTGQHLIDKTAEIVPAPRSWAVVTDVATQGGVAQVSQVPDAAVAAAGNYTASLSSPDPSAPPRYFVARVPRDTPVSQARFAVTPAGLLPEYVPLSLQSVTKVAGTGNTWDYYYIAVYFDGVTAVELQTHNQRYRWVGDLPELPSGVEWMQPSTTEDTTAAGVPAELVYASEATFQRAVQALTGSAAGDVVFGYYLSGTDIITAVAYRDSSLWVLSEAGQTSRVQFLLSSLGFRNNGERLAGEADDAIGDGHIPQWEAGGSYGPDDTVIHDLAHWLKVSNAPFNPEPGSSADVGDWIRIGPYQPGSSGGTPSLGEINGLNGPNRAAPNNQPWSVPGTSNRNWGAYQLIQLHSLATRNNLILNFDATRHAFTLPAGNYDFRVQFINLFSTGVTGVGFQIEEQYFDDQDAEQWRGIPYAWGSEVFHGAASGTTVRGFDVNVVIHLAQATRLRVQAVTIPEQTVEDNDAWSYDYAVIRCVPFAGTKGDPGRPGARGLNAQQVEANPSDDATETLDKLKITPDGGGDGTVYEIPTADLPDWVTDDVPRIQVQTNATGANIRLPGDEAPSDNLTGASATQAGLMRAADWVRLASAAQWRTLTFGHGAPAYEPGEFGLHPTDGSIIACIAPIPANSVYVATSWRRIDAIGAIEDQVAPWALDAPGAGAHDGKWVAGRAYHRGETVTWGPRIYDCLQSHTSNTAIAPGIAGGAAYWQERVELHVEASPLGLPLGSLTAPMAPGDEGTISNKGWMYPRGDWAATNNYYLQNVVTHDGELWVCTVEHLAAASEEPSDGATNWDRLTSGGSWASLSGRPQQWEYDIALTPWNIAGFPASQFYHGAWNLTDIALDDIRVGDEIAFSYNFLESQTRQSWSRVRHRPLTMLAADKYTNDADGFRPQTSTSDYNNNTDAPNVPRFELDSAVILQDGVQDQPHWIDLALDSDGSHYVIGLPNPTRSVWVDDGDGTWSKQTAREIHLSIRRWP